MSASKTIGTQLYKKANSNFGETTDLRIAHLTSIGAIGLESDEIETTDLDSPEDFKEYIAGAKNPMDIDIEGNLKDELAMQQILALANTRSIETWEVIYPSGAKWSFSAYVKSFADGDKTTDGLLTFSTGLRVSGKPTFTPAGQSKARYTVRYYLDALTNIAIAVEEPSTAYDIDTVITSTKLVTDIGATWLTKYKPAQYTGDPITTPTITTEAGLTINGTPSHDIIKILYTEDPLDALAVTSVPIDGATNVAVGSTVKLTFNYQIESCPTPVFINTDTDEAIAFTSAWNTGYTELTLTPSSSLIASTKYTVTVVGAKDIYARTLANTMIDFTTAS